MLPLPEIKLGHDFEKISPNGSINLKGFHFPATMKNWVVIYTVGKYEDQDRNEVNNIVGSLSKSGERYSLQFCEPNYI